MILHIDFETYSPCDIKVKGAWNYSKHPDTEVICVGYAEDKEPAKIALPGTEEWYTFLDKCKVAKEVWAHNVSFEKCIWRNVLVSRYGVENIPEDKWYCTMVLSKIIGGPDSLKDVGTYLDMQELKDAEGSNVMLKLCRPNRKGERTLNTEHTKKDFEKLFLYCKQDVEAERNIHKLLPIKNEKERQVYLLDQKINQEGFLVDRELAEKIVKLMPKILFEANSEMNRLTGGMVNKVTEIAKLTEWVEYMGIKTDSLAKDFLERLLSKDIPDSVRKALILRRDFGKSSVAKFQKLLDLSGNDNRLRLFLAYHGAATGRWAGRGFQTQNLTNDTSVDYWLAESYIRLVRNKDIHSLSMNGSIMHIFSALVRGLIIPDMGQELFIADYANIETRVLFWLVGEHEGLKALRENKDLYVDMANSIYERQDLTKKDKKERNLGKKIILGCGYQMSAHTFLKSCRKDGLEVNGKLVHKAVKTYRDKFKSVSTYWKKIEECAVDAVKFNKKSLGDITFELRGKFLCCILPSGRKLYYLNPRIGTTKRKMEVLDSEGNTKWKEMETNGVLYDSWNYTTKKVEASSLYGGLITENIVQAIARDLLAHAMLNIDSAGFKILITVHDEIVSQATKGTRTLEEYINLMCKLPEWGKDIPVTAEGSVQDRYSK